VELLRSFRKSARMRASLQLRDGGAFARGVRGTRHRVEREDRARPYIEMSGRKGLGVKADD
jgi:hypothetical protein